MEQIQKLHEEYHKQGLTVIGITLESKNDRLKKIASDKKIAYPILFKGLKTFRDYKLGQVPDICIINQKLCIESMYIGFHPDNEKKIEDEVKKLLATIKVKGEGKQN